MVCLSDQNRSLSFLDSISVIVICNILFIFWGRVRRIPPEAPVSDVNVQREIATIGGEVKVALNLDSLGVRVKLSGIMGNDQKLQIS